MTSDGDGSARVAFLRQYDDVMQAWPDAGGTHRHLDLPSDFGTTRVWAAGADPADDSVPALVLLPAYQATSAEWIPVAKALGARRRVFAVDVPGDAGRSARGSRSLDDITALAQWLDTVLDGLGLAKPEIGGHSYGAWIALRFAIDSPARVSRVVLIDPTMTFLPLFPTYVLRAAPAMSRPSAQRRIGLVRWENKRSGHELDENWLAMAELAGEAFPKVPTAPTPIPKTTMLQRLTMPVDVVVPGRSRVHVARTLARRARARLPQGTVHTVADAGHYNVPWVGAAEIAAAITGSARP